MKHTFARAGIMTAATAILVASGITGSGSFDRAAGHAVHPNRAAVAGVPAPGPGIESWDRFTGEWRTPTTASQIVEQAINQATASMSVFSRGVARGRLRKANATPATIRLKRRDAVFVIQYDDEPELHLPLSGE